MNDHTDRSNQAYNARTRSWVPLSADQIRQRAFRETSFARRAYRPEEVDLFLGRVAEEIERWATAYTEAQNEIYRLKNYFRNQGVDPDATRSRELANEAAAVLAQAQAHADQLIADAQAHARAIQHDVRVQAQAVVAHAREEARRAAYAYRARIGDDYISERKQAEGFAALGGAATHIEGARVQKDAVADAIGAELDTFTTSRASDAYVGRATPPVPQGQWR